MQCEGTFSDVPSPLTNIFRFPVYAPVLRAVHIGSTPAARVNGVP
jgi:hypothetical protein